jgi:hypothetical protein
MIVLGRSTASLVITLAAVCVFYAQPPSPSTPSSDLEYVEKLLVARRDYQKALEQLRAHYLKVADIERARWAEDELLQFHRIPKNAFRLDLDVPPPNLRATANIPEANQLYMAAMEYKGRGWGTDYLDNQRRAELLLQEILTKFPESNRISDVAYQLGDIYESRAYRQYRRAALYFERCVQWNPTNTSHDARLRAARLYDRNLQERGDAIRIYNEIMQHETEPARLNEAKKRLGELSAR